MQDRSLWYFRRDLHLLRKPCVTLHIMMACCLEYAEYYT